MVEVSALISPELMVEIEVDAFVSDSDVSDSAGNNPSGPGE